MEVLVATRPRPLLLAVLAAALAALVVAAGLVSGLGTGLVTGPTPARASTELVAQPAPSRRVDKLLVFVVENHSLGEMRRGLPYVQGLARRYGYAADYHGLTHPSLPNYLAMVGGSTFGVRDDASPTSHRIHAPTVFGRALAHGSTATVYADAMASRCRTVNGPGRYAVRHNPWTYFVDERSACQGHDLPLRRLAGDVDAGALPAVGMVVPDLCHDAHDCALASADRWLRQRIGQVLRGPDWASGHLAVVVTADEDDNHHGNRVLTVVAHPALHGRVVRARLTHLGLARAYADTAGVPAPGNAAGARSLLGAFGLTTGG